MKEWLQAQVDNSLFSPKAWDQDQIVYREQLRVRLKKLLKDERRIISQ